MRELSNYSEDQLLKGFREGKEKSFSDVFKRLYPALCFFALRITGDQAAAEDIAAEAFIAVWDRRELFYQFNVLKSYLYTTTRNAGLKWVKQVKRQKTAELESAPGTTDHDQYVLNDIIRAETFREIYQALDKLPQQCRKIMTMLYVEGKNTRQVATELQLAHTTVKTQKARGLMLLKKRIPAFLLLVLAYAILLISLILDLNLNNG